ncbi:MAG: ABC transporter ATP-binding protein [Oscillospiraceae bacterium]|nr:ABC transporter ATP-binding protein [Oscillospiraceae bacterium]
MSVLEVRGLCKSYSAFKLENVDISLEQGKITGFIGRNGAGKTTTLKAIMDFVHPDAGEILLFDRRFAENENEIKQRVGFVTGGIDYYGKKKIKRISAVTSFFYKRWDAAAYAQYMKLFALDENKTPSELSEGMKVKYALTLALSHNAELLILDEPTSGLDPVSRDDLLDVFMELAGRGITILFSTHITSDLDKCADNIVYIKNGRILAESDMSSFVGGYAVAELESDEVGADMKKLLIGLKRGKTGYTALVRARDAGALGAKTVPADLESIMVHMEKEAEI